MTERVNESEDLLAAVEAEVDAGRSFALATIVRTDGSTYRHAGARLLVRDDGTWHGNISGGCLEGEVVDVGGRVIDTRDPELAAYDLTADEEAIWGWGLGCNGAIDVLVEGPDTAMAAIRALRRGAATARPYVLATVVRSDHDDVPAAGHLLVTEEGDADDGEALGPATAPVVAAAREVLARRGQELQVLTIDDAEVEVFLERRHPPLKLVVCGAGHDAIPLVRAGAELGWHVTVADDRSSFLHADRFPGADELVHTEPAKAADAVGADDLTYAVVMTHNFLRDVDYLGSFLGTEVAYLGMLGPSARLERLLEQLAERDIHPSDADRVKLHGPAGLDLGAEGPTEIAWAICAEILAVARGHGAGFLRDRKGPIHASVRG